METVSNLMGRPRDNEGNIRTVTLAKGTRSGASSPMTFGTPSSTLSLDGVMSPRAHGYEGFERNDPLRKLCQVNILELLDQDRRPTLIVDELESSSPGAYSFRAIYANSTLRRIPGLLDRLTGRATSSNSSEACSKTEASEQEYEDFAQFKAWLFSNRSTPSSAQSHKPPPIQPSVVYCGFEWSWSTLRRRFRVVSGVPDAYAEEKQLSEPTHTSPVLMSRSDTVTEATATQPCTSPSPSPSPPTVTRSGQERAGATGYFDSCVARQQSSGLYNRAAPPNASDYSAVPLLDGVTRKLSAQTLHGEKKVENELVEHHTIRKDVGFFDWTRLPISFTFPPHIGFARSFDWASTSLGPIEYWPPELRQMCNLVMASPHPAATFWGDDLIVIYNEAYKLIAGQKHPHIMGQSIKVAWAEIWDEIGEYFASAKWTGQSTMKDDDCLMVHRNGFLEEAYFSWSIIPMIGADGTVMGMYNPAFEKTKRKVAERRMITLREIGERSSSAHNMEEFWAQALEALSGNEYDIPFVLLYSMDEGFKNDEDLKSGKRCSSKMCTLMGALGIPQDHPIAPARIDMGDGTSGGLGPIFKRIMKSNSPALIQVGSDIPAEMLQDIEWRGFGDPCRDVVVCPISPTTGGQAAQPIRGEAVPGFLVMGVNPRRPYDEDYSLFSQLVSRQMATSLASVMLLEEEIRRGQHAARLAAIDRMELSEQLAARTQEAIESETKFTRMAHLSPAGLFIADSDGHVTYCNDAWSEITKVQRDEDKTYRWIDSVNEEDQPQLKKLWSKIVEHAQPVTAELRFKQPPERKGEEPAEDTWVLFSASPEKNDDGTLKSVFGSITNISSQKWAETFQKRKMEEAMELKRQQENFIDITSHEMRNPLSAILQCADEITVLLSEKSNDGSEGVEVGEGAGSDVIANCIDAAQTISLCAMHQKRIVDDILTFSKLDSAMLVVTPVDVQPITVVQKALKMFEGELQTADIQLQFQIEDSFRQLQIDWVRLDPSRVLQVLINLTTNAIKFTSTQQKRTIKVTVGAMLEKPSTLPCSQVKYFPLRSKRKDLTAGPEWGEGEVVYVRFAVKDTGRGLNAEEMKLLFVRFSQLSPRTHVQYGGSGLGLFISRELTELQGGEIGVASEAGKGSTFAFYVKARRSMAPADPMEQITPSFARTGYDDRHRLKKILSKETVDLPLEKVAGNLIDIAKQKTREDMVNEGLVRSTPLTSPAIDDDAKKFVTPPAPPTSSTTVTTSPSFPFLKPATSTLDSIATSSISTSAANPAQTPAPTSTLKPTPTPTPTPTPNTTSATPKVLICEDNTVNQQVLKKQLERKGCTVYVSNHGGEAIDFLRACRYWRDARCASHGDGCGGCDELKHVSVVLMDLEMPVMDGLTCVREIRRLQRDGWLTRPIPVIAVTANARGEQVRMALEAGMDDVVTKPFRVPDLMKQIGVVCERLAREV